MRTLIHQHRGMNTYRTDEGILQVVHRRDGKALYDVNYSSMHNAAEKMRTMADSGFTPQLLFEGKHRIVQEDLGDSENPQSWAAEDWQNFRREIIRCLIKLRQKRIRHGDLNGNNIIIRDKKPHFIDWQEAHYFGEKPPQVNIFSDTYWLCANLIKWVNNPVLSDPYRVTRRWLYIVGDLGACHHSGLPLEGRGLLDIGCFQGDFSAFAAAEGMNVVGIDSGHFRHDENSIEIARQLWPNISNLAFAQVDVHEWDDFRYPVILFMDTFPYIVRDRGKQRAISLLNRMVKDAECIYFETQMDGDQSGISWLKTDEDVVALVPGADWKMLARVPENGIDRTIWRIRHGS